MTLQAFYKRVLVYIIETAECIILTVAILMTSNKCLCRNLAIVNTAISSKQNVNNQSTASTVGVATGVIN